MLNSAPLERAGQIALEGRILFDDDPAALVNWVAETRKIWLDERPRFEQAHREFLEPPVIDEAGSSLAAQPCRPNRPPDSSVDALRVLGERDVIDAALASELAQAAGFRNELVHQCTQVDDDIVIATLNHLDTFDRFVAEVSTWLTQQ